MYIHLRMARDTASSTSGATMSTVTSKEVTETRLRLIGMALDGLIGGGNPAVYRQAVLDLAEAAIEDVAKMREQEYMERRIRGLEQQLREVGLLSPESAAAEGLEEAAGRG